MSVKAKNISPFTVNVTAGPIKAGEVGELTEAELSTLWSFFEKVEEKPKETKSKEK